MLTNIWGSEYKINYSGEELDFKRVKVIKRSLQPKKKKVNDNQLLVDLNLKYFGF